MLFGGCVYLQLFLSHEPRGLLIFETMMLLYIEEGTIIITFKGCKKERKRR